jgi:hypothetical protein
MTTTIQDMEYLSAGLDELEDYLQSEELYWKLSVHSSLPRLTIGSLLLASKKLNIRLHSETDIQKLQELRTLLEVTRFKWPAIWGRKIKREFHARLDLWQNYLQDYFESPDIKSSEYGHQVQWRVILHLLSGEITTFTQESYVLSQLDRNMTPFWLQGDFVWEPDLKQAFPEKEFWFLYGKLRQ